jgi:hypothetical protein
LKIALCPCGVSTRIEHMMKTKKERYVKEKESERLLQKDVDAELNRLRKKKKKT